MRKSKMIERIKENTRVAFANVSEKFNKLSTPVKKAILLFFGLTVGSICLMLVLKPLMNQERSMHLAVQQITTPTDTYMEQDTSNEKLMPIGKFKGEMNGEFEAFYLAMDGAGKLYTKDSLEFSKDAYLKSKGWKLIMRNEVDEYEKHLHFIPHRSKGLKR